MDRAELNALLTLSLTRGLGPTLTRRSIAALGSPDAVLAARVSDLSGIEGIGPKSASAIRRSIDELADGVALNREWELIEAHHVTLLADSDPAYPGLLRLIPDPPPLLYVRGEITQPDRLAIAIVGARKCTGYGREQADRVTTVLAQAGMCIVSGGAYGIDAAAHRAALRTAAGRTIAVVGSGLARPYPDEHADIFDAIANGRGAVVSELPMSSPAVPENFPRRNRIISGLSLGVLVVEAANRSGALITARLCSEEHNREVMAMPGRVDSPTSAGCHKIIREGWATLVTSAADVLDALGETGSLLKAGLLAEEPGKGNDSGEAAGLFVHMNQSLTDSQRKIVDSLGEPKALDELSAVTGLPIHVIQADLTVLDIRSVIRKDAGKFALRRPAAQPQAANQGAAP